MDEEKFYTRDELTTLSDLALIEVRSTYQRLHALLERETGPECDENRDRIEEMLQEIQAEMLARGLTSTGGPNTS